MCRRHVCLVAQGDGSPAPAGWELAVRLSWAVTCELPRQTDGPIWPKPIAAVGFSVASVSIWRAGTQARLAELGDVSGGRFGGWSARGHLAPIDGMTAVRAWCGGS